MNIFGQIEKLINEHGSATILKERLALAKEQYSILEKKNELLKTENENLKERLKHSQFVIERLEQTVENLSKSQKENTLDDTTVKILDCLFNNPRGLSQEEVSSRIELDLGIVSYHFDILQEIDFIIQTTAVAGSSLLDARGGSSSYRPAEFGITAAGRKYIMEVKHT